MTKQIKSKERVKDKGEVFTNEREVNSMLDLVKSETERIDSRFLEPACGSGNFLIEILRRKLVVVTNRYKRNQTDWERYAVVAYSSCYGVDILEDNCEECRERLLKLGISQMSGGSKTSVGGYFNPMPDTEDSSQFDISDRRPLDEVIKWLMELGYLPSFCTACYRAGRTGERFMEVCKQQQIHNFCHPNAIITLKEYLEDYASEETKKLGEKFIEHEMQILESPENIRTATAADLKKIEAGERDFRF